MALLISTSTRCRPIPLHQIAIIYRRHYSADHIRQSYDPLVEDIGRAIEDDYATIRARYREFVATRPSG